ncbi:MAG: hypothetical protein ACRCZZ_09575 [Phocaeicola sp.]
MFVARVSDETFLGGLMNFGDPPMPWGNGLTDSLRDVFMCVNFSLLVGG